MIDWNGGARSNETYTFDLFRMLGGEPYGPVSGGGKGYHYSLESAGGLHYGINIRRKF